MRPHARRTFILSIIKTIIWAVIAVALVKFAFFPSHETLESREPTGDFSVPTTQVSTGSISQEISLQATVVRNEAVPVKSTATGQVVKAFVSTGAALNAQAPVIQVKQIEESDNPEVAPRVSWINVVSPAAGKLTLDVIVGQQVTIGDVIGHVQPESFQAVVQVTPEQLYSLDSLPEQAELAIKDGPAPFPCTGLRTVAATASTSDDSANSQASGAQVRCDIPGDQRVFDGVRGKLHMGGSEAVDVLTVPVSAVEGRFREGRVYLPAEDGKKPEAVTVQLGITDGTLIEIKEGLEEGQEILEFVPRSDSDDEAQER